MSLLRAQSQSKPLLGDHDVDGERGGSEAILGSCPMPVPYPSVPLLDAQLADAILGLALRGVANRAAHHLGGHGERPSHAIAERAS
jgi:hypothetical protein